MDNNSVFIKGSGRDERRCIDQGILSDGGELGDFVLRSIRCGVAAEGLTALE